MHHISPISIAFARLSDARNRGKIFALNEIRGMRGDAIASCTTIRQIVQPVCAQAATSFGAKIFHFIFCLSWARAGSLWWQR